MAASIVFYFAHAKFRSMTEMFTTAISRCSNYHPFVASSIPEMKASPLFGRIDIVVLYFQTPPEVLQEVMLHNDVKWIHCLSVGVNTYMIPEVLSSKALITNAKGVYSEELANWTIGAVLHFTKQVARLEENKKTKTWDMFYMDVLYGKTILILGYGNIGSTIAKRAKHGFQMRVIGLRKIPSPSPHADEVHSASLLHSFLPQADVLVIAVPQIPETINIISETELSMMKPTAIIVSIGRGSQVDESALMQRLKDGMLRGAALDVFQKEPLPRDSPLWTCPNLIISPHSACISENSEGDIMNAFMKTLQAFDDGRIAEMENVIDRSKGY